MFKKTKKYFADFRFFLKGRGIDINQTISLFKRTIKIILSGKKIPKMDHVAVVPTYDCNLSCSFCYAKDLKKDLKKNMVLEDFKRIIKWVKPQNKEIKFLGGEPTSHPDFPEMIELCKKNKIDFVLITNNLFGEKVMQSLKGCKPGLRVGVNYNPKSFYNKKDYALFFSNLKKLREEGFSLAFIHNIRKLDDPLEYKQLVLDAKKYKSLIGLSLIFPYNLKQNDQTKEVIMEILSNAKKERTPCVFFRPLPKCIFTEKEWKKLKKNLDKYYYYSTCDLGPVIINPNLTIFPCHGLKFAEEKSLFSFKNLEEIHNYYEKEIAKISWKPLDEKCVHCKYLKDRTCPGGCLANKHLGGLNETHQPRN